MQRSVNARDDAGLLDVAHDGPLGGTATSRADGGELLFFCPDVTDASTLKRVQQFMDFGYRVTVFGFRRERYNTAYQPPWPNIPLGFTSDARYWHRVRALLRAIPALFARRGALKRAAVFYARNIDQLLLALLARLICASRAPVTYEVLDIPPILMRRGAGTDAPQGDRAAVPATGQSAGASPRRPSIATTMPPSRNFAASGSCSRTSCIPRSPRRRAAVRRAAERGRPWVVGYFGLIRGESTFALMTRLAERLQGRILFKFGGILTTVDQAKFDEVLRRCPNIVYGGPYLPQQDLEHLYRDVDFTWALDLEHTDHNSRWLMPCRFYEAGYFGVPCLAVHGFEVGNTVEKHRIGWTFDAPLEESLVRFFERLTPADYEHIRGRLRSVPRSMFVAGDDVARLCALIAPGRA